MECTAHYADLNVYFSDISTSNGGILASSPEKRAGPSSGFRSVCGAFLLDFIYITKGKKNYQSGLKAKRLWCWRLSRAHHHTYLPDQQKHHHCDEWDDEQRHKTVLHNFRKECPYRKMRLVFISLQWCTCWTVTDSKINFQPCRYILH